MIFRNANVHDAESIVEFQMRMARETESVELDRAICSRGVRAVFERRELGEYYVAEEEGELAGSLLITYEWSDWRNGMVWWIQSVYVPEEFRRRGVYSGLYRHVMAIVKQSPDVRGIRLYVDRRNTRAQHVYARLGMNGEHYQVFEWMK